MTIASPLGGATLADKLIRFRSFDGWLDMTKIPGLSVFFGAGVGLMGLGLWLIVNILADLFDIKILGVNDASRALQNALFFLRKTTYFVNIV